MNICIEIFNPIAERISKRADSLRAIKKFPQGGIESWLKVEVLAALEAKVKRVKNNGPDLELEGGIFLELKGMTNFSASYILTGLKYEEFPEYKGKTLCLFLADGSDPNQLARVKSKVKWICEQMILDANQEGSWILGLIAPI